MTQIPVPLSVYQVDRYVLTPALELLPAAMDTPEARAMLHAIGLQESRYRHRRQIRGPARGLWQAELGSLYGTNGRSSWGILNHGASRDHVRTVCAARGVTPDARAIHAALEHDDILAAACARLLLWTDPKPLPRLGDEIGAWSYYIRNWRPGKPHRSTWGGLYREAIDFVQGNQ